MQGQGNVSSKKCLTGYGWMLAGSSQPLPNLDDTQTQGVA